MIRSRMCETFQIVSFRELAFSLTGRAFCFFSVHVTSFPESNQFHLPVLCYIVLPYALREHGHGQFTARIMCTVRGLADCVTELMFCCCNLLSAGIVFQHLTFHIKFLNKFEFTQGFERWWCALLKKSAVLISKMKMSFKFPSYFILPELT